MTRPRRLRPLTLVLLLVAVLVGTAVARVDTWWPVYTSATVRGEVGDVVTSGPMRVRVDDVRTGTLTTAGFGADLTTGGVFVGVDLALSGVAEDSAPGALVLRTQDGTDYEATIRADDALANLPQAPDVPMQGTVVFEVPAAALDGDLRLRLLTQWLDADDDRPQAVAEVALGRVAPPADGDVLEPLEQTLVPGGWGG